MGRGGGNKNNIDFALEGALNTHAMGNGFYQLNGKHLFPLGGINILISDGPAVDAIEDNGI